MMARYRNRKRRGVLILVVMSLLVLFLLAAVAFVLNASQQHTAAKSAAKKSLTGDPPEEQLEEALRVLLRGPKNTPTVSKPGFDWKDSLLGDMYGGDGVILVLNKNVVQGDRPSSTPSPDFAGDGQFLDLEINANPATGSPPPSTEPLFYAGATVVFLDGHQRFSTGRVVVNDNPSSPFTLRIYTDAFDYYSKNLPKEKDRLFVNRRPFNSTGAEPNEDYDAPDNANLFLGAQIPVDVDPDPAQVRMELHEIPSFDRTQSGGSTARVFGPVPKAWDHPNPAVTPSIPENPYPWDVDSDGDGNTDAVWVDLGFSMQRTRDGRTYRPLFAFRCLDMDGRLNLNAQGSAAVAQENGSRDPSSASMSVTGVALAGGGDTDDQPRGFGIGPPEINLARLMNSGTDEFKEAVGQRYGNAAGVDVNTIRPRPVRPNAHSELRFAEAPKVFGESFSAYASPFDWQGRFGMGLSAYGFPAYETDMLDTDQRSFSPYEIDLSRHGRKLPTGMATDEPFTVTELEALLRYYDPDMALIRSRLRKHFATFTSSPLAPINRASVTTDSFDVVTPGKAGDIVAAAFQAKGGAAYRLLSSDLGAGGRLNINMPLSDGIDNDGDGVVDEYDEVEDLWGTFAEPGFSGVITPDSDNDGTVNTSDSDTSDPVAEGRAYFAKRIYETLMALASPAIADPDKKRELAQWAVNVVDFRDPDSIMTRFQYGSPTEVVWGCERPELLITEILSTHDRRTSDAPSETPDNDENGDGNIDDQDKGKAVDGDDEDFDQEVMPRGALFVEIHNPWRVAHHTSGELYDNSMEITGGVPRFFLDQLSPATGMVADRSPVWRLAIDDSGSVMADPDHPTNAVDVERVVYFTDINAANVRTPGAAAAVGHNDDDAEDDIPKLYTTLQVGEMAPGGYAVIGPGGTSDGANGYVTYLGDMDQLAGAPNLTQTHRITLVPGPIPSAGAVKIQVAGAAINAMPEPVVAVAINRSTKLDDPPTRSASVLNLSEPDEGYAAPSDVTDPDFPKYSPVKDTPLDDPMSNQAQNGIHTSFRVVHLQRLANPLLPFDKIDNPYLTVDSMAANLYAFNGYAPDTNDPKKGANEIGKLATRQRGDDVSGDKVFWRVEADGESAYTATGTVANHSFDPELQHTLGYLNRAYQDTSLASPTNAPVDPYPWLTWNNRPYVSQNELMLVPKTSSSNLVRRFSLYKDDLDDPSVKGFDHLFNFQASYTGLLRRFLDVSFVPSRFSGMEIVFNPLRFQTDPETTLFRPPFNRVSSLREPGKINLNTIFDPRVYEALMHMNTNLVEHDGPQWRDFVDSRRGSDGHTNRSIVDVMHVPDSGAVPFFAQPFRSMSDADIAKTMLRNHPSASVTRPFFSSPDLDDPVNSTRLYDDPTRNAYFQYQGIQRLANLVTTRSNVFAVWVTMGYFEVDPSSGNLRMIDTDGDGNNDNGIEIGSDTGEVERHRSFFMIDRSIPVAFEHGKDHNIEDAVVLRSFIE